MFSLPGEPMKKLVICASCVRITSPKIGVGSTSLSMPLGFVQPSERVGLPSVMSSMKRLPGKFVFSMPFSNA